MHALGIALLNLETIVLFVLVLGKHKPPETLIHVVNMGLAAFINIINAHMEVVEILSKNMITAYNIRSFYKIHPSLHSLVKFIP